MTGKLCQARPRLRPPATPCPRPPRGIGHDGLHSQAPSLSASQLDWHAVSPSPRWPTASQELCVSAGLALAPSWGGGC